MFWRSAAMALFIAAAVQCFMIGILAPQLPQEVLTPELRDIRTLTLAAAPLVRLDNADGGLTVSTHEQDEILVTADIRAYGSSSQKAVAEEYLATLLEIENTEKALQIITEPEKRPEVVDLRVDYALTVPRGTGLEVVCTNGNVWVGAGCGRVTVEGNNTDIEITEPHGAVVAKSTIGRIRVHNAVENTWAETVNGSVYADMKGGTLRASTTNGHIYASLLDPGVRWCDLTAVNGNITLVMAEDCSAEVNATAHRGVVSSDIVLDQLEGERRRRELHTRIGAGDCKLTMKSLNGDIWITRSAT